MKTRIFGVIDDDQDDFGHSCSVGEDALLCAQVGTAGSSKVGDRVILTGQVGIAGHVTVGFKLEASQHTTVRVRSFRTPPSAVPPVRV